MPFLQKLVYINFRLWNKTVNMLQEPMKLLKKEQYMKALLITRS